MEVEKVCEFCIHSFPSFFNPDSSGMCYYRGRRKVLRGDTCEQHFRSNECHFWTRDDFLRPSELKLNR